MMRITYPEGDFVNSIKVCYENELGEKEIRKGTEKGKTMCDRVVCNGGTLTNGLDPSLLTLSILPYLSLSLTEER